MLGPLSSFTSSDYALSPQNRFGVPHTPEYCSKNGLECGGQDRKAGSEADRNVPRAGTLLAPAQNGGSPSESASEGSAGPTRDRVLGTGVAHGLHISGLPVEPLRLPRPACPPSAHAHAVFQLSSVRGVLTLPSTDGLPPRPSVVVHSRICRAGVPPVC